MSERKNGSRLASIYGSKLNCGMKTAFLKTPCPKEEGKKKKVERHTTRSFRERKLDKASTKKKSERILEVMKDKGEMTL